MFHTRKIKTFEYNLTLLKQDLNDTGEKLSYKNKLLQRKRINNQFNRNEVFVCYSEVTTPQLKVFQIKMMLKLSGTKFGVNLKNLITMHCG